MAERQAAIGIALIDNRIIVGRRKKNPSKNKLEIPGGKVDDTDTNTAETIFREFQEEIPELLVEAWTLAFVQTLKDIDDPETEWSISCYIGECADLPPSTGPAHSEIFSISEDEFHNTRRDEWALNHYQIIANFWQYIGA